MAKLSRISQEYHFDILFGIHLHENISILVVFQKVIATFRSWMKIQMLLFKSRRT